jgi:toxin ParE1/3/4
MTKLFLTSRALDDIQEIYDYSLKKWGKDTALKYIRTIEDALSLLKGNHGLLRINTKISSKFVAYHVQRHCLICDLIDGHIVVLTVKHHSMDLLERLKKLEPTLDNEAKILRDKVKF